MKCLFYNTHQSPLETTFHELARIKLLPCCSCWSEPVKPKVQLPTNTRTSATLLWQLNKNVLHTTRIQVDCFFASINHNFLGPVRPPVFLGAALLSSICFASNGGVAANQSSRSLSPPLKSLAANLHLTSMAPSPPLF